MRIALYWLKNCKDVTENFHVPPHPAPPHTDIIHSCGIFVIINEPILVHSY